MVKEIKKIYVDSRFRNDSSASSTDFRMQLTESVQVPDNTAVIVTDICIPHTWYTIEYYNDKLYWRLWDDNTGAFSDKVTTTPHRNYDINSLAQTIAFAMSSTVLTPNLFEGTADVTTGRITIALDEPSWGQFSFNIYNDRTLSNKVLEHGTEQVMRVATRIL